MERDYSAFCCEGAKYESEYLNLPTGVSLLAVSFTPPAKYITPVIIFIPGLASVIDNFRETLIELTRSHRVLYVETREKSSSKTQKRHGFSVADITHDLVHLIDSEFNDSTSFVMVGYSLGATAIAESFAGLRQKPEKMVLIEPNTTFKFPGWLLFLARGARFVYYPVKPLLKWYMRRFRINLDEDYEMYLINCRILDSADPGKLGAAVRALSSYKTGDCLKEISVPVMVVVASKDKFHSHEEGVIMAGNISGCTYIDMTDNKRTHSAEMGRMISDFIS